MGAFSLNDRTEAKLYDVQSDPQQRYDIAWDNPETVEKIFEECVLKDAGGPLPTY